MQQGSTHQRIEERGGGQARMEIVGEPSEYAGMTLNERLVVAGTLAEFDNAVRRGDRDAMFMLLLGVEIEAEAARETIDAVLSNPKEYGY
jgi:hypothetical protein